MTKDFDDLSNHAARHHGLFRRADAKRLGIGTHRLEGLVASGWCARPVRGVYRVGGSPATSEQAVLAAVWGSDEDAVASHLAAARLWDLPGFGRATPEVTRPRGQNQRLSIGVVHGSMRLPSTHTTQHSAIPVTTPARTIFDLAGVLTTPRTANALDAALSRRLCTIAQLDQVFFALARRGRRGTAAMRELLEARGLGYVPPASELERRARQVFRDGGPPQPAYEVDLGDDAWIGRVDCVWRDSRVIVELDGRRFHDGLSSRTADRERDNRLMAQGWRVIRVTWDDIVQRPQVVVNWIRTALRAAG